MTLTKFPSITIYFTTINFQRLGSSLSMNTPSCKQRRLQVVSHLVHGSFFHHLFAEFQLISQTSLELAESTVNHKHILDIIQKRWGLSILLSPVKGFHWQFFFVATKLMLMFCVLQYIYLSTLPLLFSCTAQFFRRYPRRKEYTVSQKTSETALIPNCKQMLIYIQMILSPETRRKEVGVLNHNACRVAWIPICGKIGQLSSQYDISFSFWC